MKESDVSSDRRLAAVIIVTAVFYTLAITTLIAYDGYTAAKRHWFKWLKRG